MQPPHRKNLSLILPCYNASLFLQQELPGIVGYLERHIGSFEIIMVDDGSADGQQTETLAQQYGCIFYRHPCNQGKGAALKKGFSLATGAVQVFTDSDFPFEPEALLQMYRMLQRQEADIVIGDRTNPLSSYYLEVSWVRKAGSFLIASIGKRLLKNHIIDTQCGLKGFSAQTAAVLFPQTVTQRFGIDFELLYLASRQGMRIEKIPVRLRTRYPSSVNIVSDGLKIIQEIYQAIKRHGSKQKR